MKYLSKIVFSIILSLTFFISCSEEHKIEEERISATDMEFVGLEHNEILEKTFNVLKKEKKDIKNQIKLNSKKNHLERIIVGVISNTEKYTEESKKNGIQSVKDFFKKQNTLSKSNSINNLQAEYLLLPDQDQFYLGQLDLILSSIDTINIKNNSTLESIINLEIAIGYDQNLNNKQLLILFSATQTAKYSFSYWRRNLMSWIDKGGDELSRPGCPTDCPIGKANIAHLKEIVTDDAAGAVAGAVGAAAANIIVGAGTAAYGAAIVTTAAAASAFTAAKKLISWLWS
jgi:hypothetical protein